MDDILSKIQQLVLGGICKVTSGDGGTTDFVGVCHAVTLPKGPTLCTRHIRVSLSIGKDDMGWESRRRMLR